MKKLFLNVFVLTGLLLTTSCNKDDDGGGNSGASNRLTVTIDGEAVTFDDIIVDSSVYTYDDGEQVTELDVTATIGGDSTRIVNFYTEVGDTGTYGLYSFNYLVDGEYYYNNGGFNTVVSVNNGSRLTATFSGALTTFTSEGEETVMFENGTIDVNY